jgi:hypothetical protein
MSRKETKICIECKVEKSITAFRLNNKNGNRNKKCKSCVTIKINNGAKKLCRACNIVKNIDEFPTTSTQGLKASRCKLCKSNKILIPIEKRELNSKTKFITQRLTNITKEDYKDAYIFLRDALGFDLKSKLSIHEQFCLKHNLTPHNPLNTFKEYYSIEECFNKKSI